jgi:hypothetical protein
MTTEQPLALKPAPHVLSQELNGETVLLDLEAEHYYGLDDVGTRVWQLLSEHGDIAAVVARMRQEYAVDEETLREDVLSLVDELRQKGLVIASTRTPGGTG